MLLLLLLLPSLNLHFQLKKSRASRASSMLSVSARVDNIWHLSQARERGELVQRGVIATVGARDQVMDCNYAK